MKLDYSFYDRPTVTVARDLLGKLLLRKSPDGLVSGLIVEVEAYLANNDEASHSFSGIKNKNRTMFDSPGTLYVYPIHAKYCMNVVTEQTGLGAAVLIRAVEPVQGVELMQSRRGEKIEHRDLTRGPARLCQAFAIDRTFDGLDLTKSKSIWLEDATAKLGKLDFSVSESERIGISRAQEHMLRFFVDGNRFVSGCVRCHTRPNKDALLEKIEP
jgi:DNA-3-methyladenine glycosylase